MTLMDVAHDCCVRGEADGERGMALRPASMHVTGEGGRGTEAGFLLLCGTHTGACAKVRCDELERM
jgi:hypothetical protein